MCDVGRVRVAGDVRGPLEDASVCVAGASIAGLKLLELLLLSKFVRLEYAVSSDGSSVDRVKPTMVCLDGREEGA